MRSSIPPSSNQIIVLSNRQPYRHERDAGGAIRCVRQSSGVVNAVEPLLLEHGGVWVAASDSPADREATDQARGVMVPSPSSRYRLRRVWLGDQERSGYYDGFANSGLWPLCHRTTVSPAFYATDFGMYELVNRRFAAAVAAEARVAAPVVLAHDYHFALAPAMMRRELPQARIATFWHIPWPSPDTLRRCPWSNALLDGLLGSTLIGFQTPIDRDNFLRCVERFAPVDSATDCVYWRGRRVRVNVYPASVDALAPGQALPSVARCRAEVRRRLHLPEGVVLGVGVDRLDYTKGLEEKFSAIERLLEHRPDLRHRFVFVQIAEPSRERLPAYRQTRERVMAAAERVNRRFGGGRLPIVLLTARYDHHEVMQYLRAADVCYVGSLHDGMNLVSKEFVMAREDEQGVLVLSAFAGASYELRDALIVNPYDREQVARTLAAAVDMPLIQQRCRLRRLRRTVSGWNARRWASAIVADALTDPPAPTKPFQHIVHAPSVSAAAL
jgi:trehalose 6-phosphate synthase